MYLVSACLAGVNCRYNGKNSYTKEIAEMVNDGIAIPICPEVLGGLTTPRNPVEIIIEDNDIKVIDNNKNDYTKNFNDGANKCLEIAKNNNIKVAILKSKSPSCGFGKIYDGSFSNKLIEGNGITSDLLSKNQIKVLDENNFRDNI